jgi:AbrB family looped-hinge helix DNA binding protein
LTSKGQVTIPIEIRRHLGLVPHDRITFVIEADQVRIVPAESVIARTAGALKSQRATETAEQLREAAEQAIAEDVIERMRG